MDLIQLMLGHFVVIGGFVVVGAVVMVTAQAKNRQRGQSKTLTRGLLLLMCALSLFAGCSKSTGRLPVRGQVSWNGEKILSGSIVFQPLKKGPKVGTKIKDGEYRFTKNNGPLPGHYKVEVYVEETDPFPMDDPKAFAEQMENDPEKVQVENSIPSKFNKQSILTAEPSQQNLEINFNLEGTDEN